MVQEIKIKSSLELDIHYVLILNVSKSSVSFILDVIERGCLICRKSDFGTTNYTPNLPLHIGFPFRYVQKQLSFSSQLLLKSKNIDHENIQLN